MLNDSNTTHKKYTNLQSSAFCWINLCVINVSLTKRLLYDFINYSFELFVFDCPINIMCFFFFNENSRLQLFRSNPPREHRTIFLVVLYTRMYNITTRFHNRFEPSETNRIIYTTMSRGNGKQMYAFRFRLYLDVYSRVSTAAATRVGFGKTNARAPRRVWGTYSSLGKQCHADGMSDSVYFFFLSVFTVSGDLRQIHRSTTIDCHGIITLVYACAWIAIRAIRLPRRYTPGRFKRRCTHVEFETGNKKFTSA